MYIRILLVLACLSLVAGCGINSVTKAEIEGIKPGSKITYRFNKDGKSWFYADKVTRIENDVIYYNAGKFESTSGTDNRLNDFDTGKEMSITKADILKFETEQPPNEKKIIWIE